MDNHEDGAKPEEPRGMARRHLQTSRTGTESSAGARWDSGGGRPAADGGQEAAFRHLGGMAVRVLGLMARLPAEDSLEYRTVKDCLERIRDGHGGLANDPLRGLARHDVENLASLLDLSVQIPVTGHRFDFSHAGPPFSQVSLFIELSPGSFSHEA
jgi:hypothetical protein